MTPQEKAAAIVAIQADPLLCADLLAAYDRLVAACWDPKAGALLRPALVEIAHALGVRDRITDRAR